MKEKNQIKQAGAEFCDPYIRYVKDIQPPIGMTAIDFSRRQPGPSLSRSKETGVLVEENSYPRDENELLCLGAAAGLDKNGVCRHVWAHFAPLRFLGFLYANLEDNQVLVTTYGAVFLTIPGISSSDSGKTVYAENCNKFTLEKTKGTCEIGIIRFVQLDVENRASVIFRKWDSKKKLEPLNRR